ncbi:MAG: hypothetical protein M1823_007974, partial [Watsoniomyces obsoletus]
RPELETGHGLVEDKEVPQTPEDEVPKATDWISRSEEPVQALEHIAAAPRPSKSERRRMERAVAHEDITSVTGPQLERAVPVEAAQSVEPESGHVFDYLVDDDGKSLPPASTLGIAASTVLSDGRSTAS